MAELVLEPVEVAGPTQWRWLLRTGDGEPLASHGVALRPTDYEYAGFSGLYRFLRWQADPDRRVVSEAGLTTRVGDWITREALGAEVCAGAMRRASYDWFPLSSIRVQHLSTSLKAETLRRMTSSGAVWRIWQRYRSTFFPGERSLICQSRA